jgi:hypothetical protein
MTGNVTADLASISPTNLLVIFGGIIGVILVIGFIIRYLNIRSIGPIKREQESYSVINEMNSANKDIDDNLLSKLRDYTDETRVSLVNSFQDVAFTGILRRALAAAVRFPMYKSINNNHFTKVLMPDRIGSYRDRILRQLRNEYEDLQIAAVADGSNLISWKDGGDKKVTDYLDQWIEYAKAMVGEACRDKISNYTDYKKHIKSDYWLKMIDGLIEKNQRYIERLK